MLVALGTILGPQLLSLSRIFTLPSTLTCSRVNFSNASEAELEHLARACDPATFGVNQKDVLDESYRKAGKIDTENFSAKFNLERSGLIDVVRFELLEGHDGKKPIEAELYKLNVYGKSLMPILYLRAGNSHSHRQGFFLQVAQRYSTW